MDNIHDNFCAYTAEDVNAFSFLEAEDHKQLYPFLQCRVVPAGTTLWKEEDICDFIAFIVSGQIELKKKTGPKGNQVVIGIFSKGSFVGTMCILDNSPRGVTAEALDDVSLLTITRENFDKLQVTHPELGIKIMKGMLLSVSKHLRNSFDRLTAIF